MSVRRVQLKWLLASFLIVLVADQISKAIIIATIEQGLPIRLDTLFYFTHQRNTGLIGGAFRGITWITYSAPVFATLVLVYLYRHLTPESRLQGAAYGLVLGGAIGNFMDRVRLQSVTDFLQFHFYFIPFDFPWKIYPAFNIADAGILTGVVLLMLGWGQESRDNVSSTA